MAGTGIRNRHRVGRYLVLDDESGFVMYDDDKRTIWDGTIRHRKNFETRQPQEFVYARNDPRPLRDIRPEPNVTAPDNTVSGSVGETTVPTRPAPGGHLFKAGIGKMVIEGSNPNTVFEVT